MKTIKKDECSYSFSNAIRTLAMENAHNFDTGYLFTILDWRVRLEKRDAMAISGQRH